MTSKGHMALYRMNNIAQKGGKKMKKSIRGIVLITLLIGIAVCMLSGSAVAQKRFKGETITVAMQAGCSWFEEFIKFINPMEEWEKKTGGKVEIIYIPYAVMEERLAVACASHSGEFDIMYTLGPTLRNFFAGQGYCLDLTDKVKPETLKVYDKGTLEMYTLNGRLYHMPAIFDGVVFFYNKEMFAKAGITVPGTMDDFFTALEKLKTALPNVYPFVGAFKAPRSGCWSFMNFLYTSGGKICEEREGKLYPALESPGGIRAFERLKRLIPYFPMGVVEYEWGEVSSLMESEKCAISQQWYDQFGLLKRTGIGDKLGVFHVPVAEKELALGDGWPIAICADVAKKSPRHQEATIDLFNFLVSPSLQRRAMEKNIFIQCIPSFLAQRMKEVVDPGWREFYEASKWTIEHARYLPSVKEGPSAMFINPVTYATHRVLLGKASPAEAAKRADQEIYKNLKEHGYYEE